MVKNVNIIVVGSLKERYWQQAEEEYLKRLTRFANVRIIEVPEERERKNAPIESVIDKEGARLLSYAKGVKIAMDAGGEMLTSPAIADMLATFALEGKSEVSFFIGGSYGLSRQVRAQADKIISMGAFTYPHQMARVMLAEQLYRAFTIKGNTGYHK